MTTPPAAARARRFPRGLAIALVVLALLVLAFSVPWKLNFLRGTIGERVQAATGRAFVIEGDLWWWWKGRLTAEGLTFANPDWAGRPQMVTVKKVDADIELWPLLRERRVVLPRVQVLQPDVWIETTADGRVNTRFDRQQKDTGSGVELGAVELDQGVLHFVRKHLQTEIVAQFETTDQGGKPGLAVKAQGRWNGLAAQAEGTGDAVLRLREASEPYHLNVAVAVADTRVKLAGSITGLAKPTAADLKIEGQGPSLGAWYRIANVGLPNTPPYRTAGRVTLADSVWQYDDFTARVGQSDLAGQVKWQRGPKRPLISGTLVSQRLDLKDFSPAVGKAPPKATEKPPPGQGKQAPKATAPPSDTLMPQMAFSAEKWDTLDADVRFEGKRIVGVGKAPFDNLKMRVRLDDRRLTLDPLQMGFASGELAGTLLVDGRVNPMLGRVDLRGRRMKLEELLPVLDNERLALGTVNAKLRLAGRGQSVGQMLAAADGEAQMAMGRGQISNLLLELVDLDAQEALGFLVRGDKPVSVRCALVDLGFEKGTATARTAVFDTNDTIIQITGNANFANERLDLRFKPVAKDVSFLTLRVPFDMKGPFRKPDISPDKGKLALRAGGALVLGSIAPVAALLALFETGPGKDADCDALVARAKGEGVPVKNEADAAAGASGTREGAAKVPPSPPRGTQNRK